MLPGVTHTPTLRGRETSSSVSLPQNCFILYTKYSILRWLVFYCRNSTFLFISNSTDASTKLDCEASPSSGNDGEQALVVGTRKESSLTPFLFPLLTIYAIFSTTDKLNKALSQQMKHSYFSLSLLLSALFL